MTQPAAVSPALWDDRLANLLNALTTELHASEPGTWVARRTRSGFTVSLTLGDDGRRRCRIASEDRPGNATAWGRFHEAVEHMVHHLGVSRWETVAPETGYRGALVEFREKAVTG